MDDKDSKIVKSDKHFFWDNLTIQKYRVDSYGDLIPERHKEIRIYYGRIIGGAIGLILLLVVIFGAVRSVGAGEVGIITRFGEVDRVAESGLAFKIPLIENMAKMQTRVQKQEVKTDAATKDLQEVNGAIAVNYTLTNENALRVYKELGINYAETVITPILHESFKQGVSGYTAEQLMANRTEVKSTIQEMLEQRLTSYGITVIDANLTDLNFSAEFNAAIEQKAVMQQEAERAKQELEKVKIEAESKIEQARAEAEAQRLQQQTLTKEMIRKMWVEKWDGKLPEVSTDSSMILDLGGK